MPHHSRCLTLVATAFLLPLGCQRDQDLEGQEQPFEPVYDVRIDEDMLDFGSHAVGKVVERTISLNNRGNVEGAIVGIEMPSEAMQVDLRSPALSLGVTTLPIHWSVEDPVVIDKPVLVHVDPGSGETETLRVPTYASGIGPDLVLSVHQHDFGALPLGCAEQLHATLSNAGNAALQIEDVTLRGGQEFTLSRGTAVPMTVPAFGSTSFTVQYKPVDDLPDGSTLRIVTDAGEEVTRVRGTGFADRSEVVQLAANPVRPVVVIVFVNEVVSSGWYLGIDEVFEASLPTLFEELQESGNPYRVAFVGLHDGTVSGKNPFIDESFSVSSAVSAAIDQTAVSSTVGDNDRMLDTLIAAIPANRSWAEDPAWIGEGSFASQPKYVLVAINDDADQSVSSASVAQAAFHSEVDEPEDIVLHGITGPLSGFTCAVANAKFKDAVDLMGGTYHDICATDWDDFWRSIMRNSVPPSLGRKNVRIPLRGTPLLSSLRVSLDGETIRTGWHWDPAEHAIIIESDYALVGEQLQIEYRTSTACGG